MVADLLIEQILSACKHHELLISGKLKGVLHRSGQLAEAMHLIWIHEGLREEKFL